MLQIKLTKYTENIVHQVGFIYKGTYQFKISCNRIPLHALHNEMCCAAHACGDTEFFTPKNSYKTVTSRSLAQVLRETVRWRCVYSRHSTERYREQVVMDVVCLEANLSTSARREWEKRDNYKSQHPVIRSKLKQDTPQALRYSLANASDDIEEKATTLNDAWVTVRV